MPAAQSAPELLGLRVPVRRFRQYEAAVQAVAAYETALSENASRRRSQGLTVTDQDQPEEAFCLFPEIPLRPPLAIIGGMGPLAGAAAFRRACERFRNTRAVVLYQACSIPDRSAVILNEGIPDSSLCREMAARLAEAVRVGVGLAGRGGQAVRCILACNTAHYFWDLLTPGLECEVQMVSLVGSSLAAIRPRSCRNALLLVTEGARVGGVFSTRFRDAGIAFEEPAPASGRLLMRTIFEGMKSFDEGRAVELGNEFFETILRTGYYDCVVAGCTEIPLTIDLLRRRGSPAVAAFLSSVQIVDPLGEALRRA